MVGDDHQRGIPEVLREVGAVNESDCVDIDTGALIFSTEIGSLSNFPLNRKLPENGTPRSFLFPKGVPHPGCRQLSFSAHPG